MFFAFSLVGGGGGGIIVELHRDHKGILLENISTYRVSQGFRVLGFAGSGGLVLRSLRDACHSVSCTDIRKPAVGPRGMKPPAQPDRCARVERPLRLCDARRKSVIDPFDPFLPD